MHKYYKNFFYLGLAVATGLSALPSNLMAQHGNYVSSGEKVIFNDVSLNTSNIWQTVRSATPSYFSAVGEAAFINPADANNVNGYVKHYANAANQAFDFTVGTGTDYRNLAISGTIPANSEVGVAWIEGNPSTTTDPTAPNSGLHLINSKQPGFADISTVGQWDWQDISGNNTGVTVTVSIPDLTAYAPADLLRLVGWNGTEWIDLSGIATASGNTENSTLSGTMVSNITAIGIGSLLDSDDDGVPDLTDIDDDNDGIKDGDENNCTPVDAFWSLDNTTNDVSGNGNNERAAGSAPPFSTEAIQGSNSANFNGTTHEIRYSQDFGFMESTYNNISFSAWIKPSNLTGQRVIYEEGGAANGFMLWLDGDTPTVTAISGGAGSETSVASELTLSTTGEWYHVAAVFNAGTMTVYVNGAPTTITAGFVTIAQHIDDGGIGGPIGAAPNGITGNYAGLMDGVKYSNSEAWGADEIGFQCDVDGDNIADQLDTDSDNDGIPDLVETGGTDSDNDGKVDDNTDTDGDGWPDTFDPDDSGMPLVDEDNDGDGVPNRLDLDSDNDGLPDIVEAGGVDTNNDGRVDSPSDSDNDGWDNTFDRDDGGTALIIPDTDGDGTLPNYLDIDSDNDGIIDNVEWQTTANFDVPSGTDANNNGWDDEYDNGSPTPEIISDNDQAGAPDYTSQNADGDAQPDWLERADDDEDGDALLDLIAIADAYETANGNPNEYVSSDDADNDDIPDFLEDADGDGLPNFLDPDNGTFYRDTDGDGLIDLYDSNQNGDNRDNVNQLGDLDIDGAPDFRDLDNDVTLPIELLKFTATKVGEYVQLDWTTATEINNDYFTIERSIDGENFEMILTEKGAGNSSSRKDYRRYDENPEVGYNYYRLKQTDYDGQFEYFDIVTVRFNLEQNQTVKIYPNPTGGQLTIETSEEELRSIRLTDLLGNELPLRVVQDNRHQGKVRIDCGGLAKGVYIIQTTSRSHRVVKL